MREMARAPALVLLLAVGLAVPAHAAAEPAGKTRATKPTRRAATTSPAGAPDTEAVVRGKLRREIKRVSFADIDFKDVVRFLRESSGANIYVNWRALKAAGIDPDTKVTVDARRGSVARALASTLEDVSGAAAGADSELAYRIEDSVIIVSTRSNLAEDRWVVGKEVPNWAAEETRMSAGVREKLAGMVERLSLSEIDLKDVMQFFAEYALISYRGTRLPVGWADTKISVDLRNITFRQGLELILRDASGTAETKAALAYTIDGGRLTISTYGELTRRIDAAHGRPWREAVTSLAPGHSRTLSFTRPGKIAKVSVREGQIVKAAQELVRLDDAAELEKLAQLELEYSDVRVRAAQAQLAQRKFYVERVDAATKKGEATMPELESAKLELRISEISVELARTQRKIDEHKYRESRIEVDRMRLISPIDGKVERIFASSGECVGLLEPVVRVVKVGSDPLWIEVPVPFSQALALKEGQPALVRLGGRWVPVRGKIVCVSATAEPTGQTLNVQVEVPNPTGRPAGERVTVSFPAEGPDKGR